jgi:hypothetical protein
MNPEAYDQITFGQICPGYKLVMGTDQNAALKILKKD